MNLIINMNKIILNHPESKIKQNSSYLNAQIHMKFANWLIPLQHSKYHKIYINMEGTVLIFKKNFKEFLKYLHLWLIIFILLIN